MTASFIRALNESDSRLHKESVLDKTLTAAKLGSVSAQISLGLTKACYNPMVTWGVKQVPSTVGIVDAQNPWTEFNTMLTDLHLRKLTGNAARDAIDTMSGRFDSDEWNSFCAAVLRKDLRAGISEKTVNKVCRGTEWEIPVFSCQLATDSTGNPEILRGKKRLEPKLDGVRVLMLCSVTDDGAAASAISYSRNGKVFENFSHVENSVLQIIDKMAGISGHTSFILDGEMIGQSFQELMKQARRKSDVKSDDTVFHVFDFIPLEDFSRGHWNTQQYKRVAILEKFRSLFDSVSNITLVPYLNVDLDTAEGQDVYHRYCQDMISAGLEGVMIKALDAPYECKRNKFWGKMKPVYDYDLIVIAIEEGTGKNVGRMGALVCEGTDDGKFIQVNVGSGFTDEQRDDYWKNQKSVIGQTAVIMADAITKNQDENYSLRFPRFKSFRDDK